MKGGGVAGDKAIQEKKHLMWQKKYCRLNVED